MNRTPVVGPSAGPRTKTNSHVRPSRPPALPGNAWSIRVSNTGPPGRHLPQRRPGKPSFKRLPRPPAPGHGQEALTSRGGAWENGLQMDSHLNRLGPRLLARLLCLCMFFSGMLTEGLHFALEDHHFCEVHQTLEHGAESGAETSRPEVASAPSAGPQATTTPEESDHGGCGLPPFSEEDGMLFVAADRQVAPDSPRRAAASPGSLRAHSSIPRFRIAPKQSPPLG